MADRIDFGGKPWTALPRDILRDPTLSPRAKGGLVCLLSHDEGYIRSCIATLMHESDCGRDQAKAIMRELVQAGYAQADQKHGPGGRFLTAYTVSATRTPKPASSDPVSYGSPGTGTPATVLPATVSPSAVVEVALEVEPTEVEQEQTQVQELTTGAARESEGPEPQEVELEQAELVHVEPVAVAKRSRKPDALFEAVMDVCNINWRTDLTKSNHSGYSGMVAQLRAIGATPAEVFVRAEVYRLLYPNVNLSPYALVKNWPVCTPDALQATASSTYDGSQARHPVTMSVRRDMALAEQLRAQEQAEQLERERTHSLPAGGAA